jgi:hypothetical protein
MEVSREWQEGEGKLDKYRERPVAQCGAPRQVKNEKAFTKP